MRNRMGTRAALGLGALLLTVGTAAVANTTRESAPEYAAMSALVGDWAGSSKVYIAPGMAPESSGGKIRTSMIGKYFVAEHVSGQAMGKAFEQLFLIGLDPVSGGVSGSLVSSSDKQARPFTGHYDDRASTWTLDHEMLSAAGTVIQARTTIHVDQRKHTQTVRTFQVMDQGFDTLVLDLQATRRDGR